MAMRCDDISLALGLARLGSAAEPAAARRQHAVAAVRVRRDEQRRDVGQRSLEKRKLNSLVCLN